MGAPGTVTALIRPPSLDMRLRPCSKVATQVQDSTASSIVQYVCIFTSCCLSALVAYNAFIYWDFIEGAHDVGLIMLPRMGTIAALHVFV